MTTLEMPYPLAETTGPGVDGDPDEALLVVSSWNARCSACGRGATTTESAHATRMPAPIAPPPSVGRGCGRRYVGVALVDTGDISLEPMVAGIAQCLGLPFVGRRPWPTPGGVA